MLGYQKTNSLFRNTVRSLVLAVCAFLAAPMAMPNGSLAVAQATDIPDGSDAIERILAHQESMRERIASIDYEIRARTQKRAPDSSYTANLTIRKQLSDAGERVEYSLDRRPIDSSDRNPENYHQEGTIVANDAYVAYMLAASSNAYIWHHATTGELNPDAKTQLDLLNSIDLLLYGFGTGLRSMRDEFNRAQANDLEWQVQQIDQGPEKGNLLLTRPPESGERPRYQKLQLIADADKSFLISRIVYYHPNGSVNKDIAVELSTAQDEIVIPKKIEMKEYTSSNTTEPPTLSDVLSGDYANALEPSALLKTQEVEVANVKINADITEQQFTWQTLGLQDGMSAIKTDADGSKELLHYEGDDLLPND